MHIAAGFVQQAQSHPEKLAVLLHTDWQHTSGYSFSELLNSAQQIARQIAELSQGLDPANPVQVNCCNRSQLKSQIDAASTSLPTVTLHNTIRAGLLLPNDIEFLQVFLGVTLGGGVAIVLDPKWSASQLSQVLESHPLDLLFVDVALAQNLTVPENLQVVGLNSGAAKSGLVNLSLIHPAATSSVSSGQHSSEPIATSDAFYVGFTSGTTGRAKGVVRSHRSWVSSFIASQIEFGTNATDRILIPGSLVHSLSLYAALEGLNAGATVYLLPQFSPKVALDCLQTEAITMLVAVPTWLGTIAKAITSKQPSGFSSSYPSLRTVIAGGAKLEPSLRSTLSGLFPHANVLEYFGALELSFIAIASSRELVPPSSVGRSFAGVTVSIQRQDGSGAAEVGEIGWIGVKSEMLSSGYWHNSNLDNSLDHSLDNSKESPDRAGYRMINGWATVGDLGWQDAEGYLYLVGREQDMLVSGGGNIYPVEIESALRSFPEIDEVVVFGIPDRDRGQAIAAAIRWAESAQFQSPLNRSLLLQRLQTLLPRAKCPRYFFTVDRFPVTGSGKVMRTRLREQCLAQLQQQRSKFSLDGL